MTDKKNNSILLEQKNIAVEKIAKLVMSADARYCIGRDSNKQVTWIGYNRPNYRKESDWSDYSQYQIRVEWAMNRWSDPDEIKITFENTRVAQEIRFRSNMTIKLSGTQIDIDYDCERIANKIRNFFPKVNAWDLQRNKSCDRNENIKQNFVAMLPAEYRTGRFYVRGFDRNDGSRAELEQTVEVTDRKEVRMYYTVKVGADDSISDIRLQSARFVGYGDDIPVTGEKIGQIIGVFFNLPK